MKYFFYIILFLFSATKVASQNSFELNELFIGEISGKVEKEAVKLGDTLAFYINVGDKFVGRYNADGNFQITLSDGRNGSLKSDNVIKSVSQNLFKITYTESFFPFSKEKSIFGTSQYSNCNFSAVLYWLKYFKDSTDFIGLTQKAYYKDTTAFFALMRQPFLDVDGSGQWSFNNWKLINSFSDKELSGMIVNREVKGRLDILKGLYPDVTMSPFGEETNLLNTYYKTWYPLTWTLIEFERKNEIHDKKYDREFRKLKRQMNKFL